ncbi:Quinoprotein alcohol dehydrogenase-like superfamily [Propionibacterium ruminifibrarum]|uniref:Quinoprotein alcohol dehydrogenase-like superfamily n=1 Tax=Propionibacterium ruminifibrarum TaxID=1962131 RepID=A0A375I7C4_9ACTN|nr:hypothetical protein [Propionibacterium ruminifibrarum]SPF69434.1 Quinoprotein alcohol dehydrogenase-like superfamily [Propionibacterium ruminifibrarum]
MLRGIRAGALLAIVALVVLAVRFLAQDIIVTNEPLVTAVLFVPVTLVMWGFGVTISWDLGPGPRGNLATAPVIIAVLSIAAMALCTGCSVRVAADSGFFLGHPVIIGVVCLCSGALAISDLLLRTHPSRDSGGPRDTAHWRPLPTDATSHTATALTGLLSVVLALAVALVPTWVARPIQQLAPKPPEIPAMPATVAGDLAWTLDLDEDVDTITAGAAGPILADGSRILGLDPADGSTRWTYHRPNAQLLNLSASNVRTPTRIITGPDHHYASFVTLAPEDSLRRQGSSSRQWTRATLVTVLDTLTGRVVTERALAMDATAEGKPIPGTQPIQLTDTAALIGTEAIDLATGTTLWALPEQKTTSSDPSAYVGPAGHSTFVLRSEPGSDMATDLVLVPQDDPDRRTHLSTVATSANRPLIIDGWTIHYTDEPTYAEGSPAAAISIDEVAAAGTAGVQGIDLGQTIGPDLALSHTSLIASMWPSEDRIDPQEQPAAVFDPATRTATPIELSSAVDATTFDITKDYEDSAYVYRLHLAAPNGSASSTTEITMEEYNCLERMNRRNTVGERFEGVVLAAVPGAVLVYVNLPSSRPTPNRLYALR